MSKYSDDYKADAIAQLIADGYPDNEYAPRNVRKILVDSYGFAPVAKTLKRWFDGREGAPPDKNVQQQKNELADTFEQIAEKYLQHASQDTVVTESKGKEAVMTAAIAVDKMRLLRNLPTEIVGVIPAMQASIEKSGESLQLVMPILVELLNMLAEHNISPSQTFQRLSDRIHGRTDNPN
jgi:hypothetical protein